MHVARERGAFSVVEVGVVQGQHRDGLAAFSRQRRHLRGEGGFARSLQAGDAVDAGAPGQRVVEPVRDEGGGKAVFGAGMRTRRHPATILQ